MLSVEPTTGEFDFSLQVTGISPSDLADLDLGPAISSVHIHNAPVGVNGPVVIDLGGGNTNANVTPFGNGVSASTSTAGSLAEWLVMIWHPRI